MNLESLNTHRLVGGTSLSLQIGHRKSIDIDLFSSQRNNDYDKIFSELQKKFEHNFVPVVRPHNGIKSEINGIKVDIVDWGDRWIREPVMENAIRLASREDIIAMKIDVFCSDLNPNFPMKPRYEKKDFIDVAVLLNEFALDEMLLFYNLKFPANSLDTRVIIERMSRFDRAENTELPLMLIDFSWEEAKSKISSTLAEYVKKLSQDHG